MGKNLFKRWRAENGGATAIEYGLIAAAISVAMAVFIFITGDELAEFYADLTQTFADSF